MKIKILGAGKTVTGSCYSISTNNEKIFVDCGMFQGGKDLERLNYEEFNLKLKEYSALVLTHAHLDHCGRIPKLVKEGFRGKIFATAGTKELAHIIMLDSANIAKKDTENENKRRVKEGLPKRKPLYTESDVKIAISLFRVVSYEEEIKITPNITAKFYNAGHILGASCIQLTINESGKKKIVTFSGDIGQKESIIVKPTEPIANSDYVFIESTYGDRLHPDISEREKELLRVINETIKKGGKLLIPSFAVERAQDILYCIGKFQEQKLIPRVEVYLDSPMAMRATEVFSAHKEYYNESVLNALKTRKDAFNFPGLTHIKTTEESKALNSIKRPCIIIAGNGMCTAGRIKHHIVNSIDNPKNTLLLVGYQAEGTLGYWLENGQKRIRLLGVQMDVRAKIESIDGFSGHADYMELISWLKNFSPKPKRVFITHGEDIQIKAFSKRISQLEYDNYVPSMNEEIEL
ncbi:MAG: MBL fold metallo-hydrolase [Candidatus Pacearchaeota archaeon]|jgi:metallo-beta-lactamase family protein